MRVYIAGLYTSNFHLGSRIYNQLTEQEKPARDLIPNYLESYHYINRQQFVDRIRKDGKQVFLDSGAFSAFTKGVKVDIKAYCRYIQQNQDIIENVDGNLLASVLDDIGNAQGTYHNQMEMEKHGVRPLPCFHYGEDPRYLEWYIKNYDHITLGGMVPITTPQLKMWLDELWDKYLTDGSGRPRLKVHAFGVTTPVLMKRYPWYSVDSSSWIQIAFSGNILVKEKTVAVSSASPNRRVEGQHYVTMPVEAQRNIDREVEKMGYSIERMKDIYVCRWAYNAMAYSMIGDKTDTSYRDHTFINQQPGLF